MTFKAVKRTLVVDEVAAALRARVLSEEVKAGDLLPPERQLAEELGVSRLTLRAALSRLLAEGLVTIRQGDGVRAADFRRTGTLEVLVDLFGVLSGNRVARARLLRDLLEVRRTVAGQLVALACSRHDVTSLHGIQEAIASLATLAERPEPPSRQAFVAVEMQISRALVRAADNRAFELILNTVERFMRANPELGENFPVDMKDALRSYRRLMELIRKRDGNTASAHVQDTMRALDEVFLKAYVRGR
jgi:DNA-binding FadR family transcriptional regulator